jgi:hypothetical protein
VRIQTSNPTATRVALGDAFFAQEASGRVNVTNAFPCSRDDRSEDTQIVAAFEYLERFYLYELSNAERAAWDILLDQRPPQDTQHRRYIVAVPTTTAEHQVTPQRRFAWAQCYGFYRLGWPAVASTSPSHAAEPWAVLQSAVPGSFTINLGWDNPAITAPGAILYLTPPVRGGYVLSPFALRPFATRQSLINGGLITVAEYPATWRQPLSGEESLFQFGLVNENNTQFALPEPVRFAWN